MGSVRKTVLRATGVIAIASALSKILGFAREMSIAFQFGSTWQTDAFNIANSIPGLLFAAVAAAIRTIFIPIFTDVATHKGRNKAFDLANNIINTTLIISGILIIIGEIFAGPLVKLFARGFEGEVFTLAVKLTRIMLPAMLFSGLTGIISGILNALQKFTAPAIVGFPYNILIITGVFTLGSVYGIYGLAISTLIAIASQVFIMLPSLKKSGFQYRFFVDLKAPELILILELIMPTLISTAMGEVNAMVDKMLASRLPEGSISALSYASRLYGLPIGIVVSAVVTAIYPTMSHAASTKNKRQFVTAIDTSIRVMSFLVLPMMVGLLVLTEPIVKVVYERGAFDSLATKATVSALFFYSIGLLAESWRNVINRGFYSLKDTLTPMFISAGAVATNIAFNFMLIGPMGHGGLALATSMSVIVAAFIAVVFLCKKTGPLGLRSVLISLLKCFIASLLMAIVSYFSWQSLAIYATTRMLLTLILFVVIALAATVYFISCYILKVEEMAFAGNLARRLFGKISKR